MTQDQGAIVPLQPLDTIQRYFDEHQEALVRCALALDGRLDLAALKEACAHVVTAVPAAAGAFDARTNCWRTFDDASVRILRLLTCDDDAFDKTVRTALLAHLNPMVAPQLRVTVVRRPTGPDTMVVCAHHMLCDFGGLRQVLALLSSAYARATGEDTGSDAAPSLTVPATRGLLQLTRNIPATHLAHVLAHDPRSPKADPSLTMPATSGSACPRLARRDIAATDFEHACAMAATVGATANDLLLASYGRTLCSAVGSDSVVLPCPIDLRRYARPGQTCGICNLTGSLSCRVSSYVREPLMATISAVSRQMRVAKASDVGLRDPLLLEAVRALPYDAMRGIFENSGMPDALSYSNLGVTHEAQVCFGRTKVTDMLVATATRPWPAFQLSTHTFGGTCTLTACMDASDEAAELAQQVLDVTAEQVELLARRA